MYKNLDFHPLMNSCLMNDISRFSRAVVEVTTLKFLVIFVKQINVLWIFEKWYFFSFQGFFKTQESSSTPETSSNVMSPKITITVLSIFISELSLQCRISNIWRTEVLSWKQFHIHRAPWHNCASNRFTKGSKDEYV